MNKIGRFFEFVLLVIISLPLAIAPYRVAIKFGEFLATIIFCLWKSRREIAINNIKIAKLGEQKDAERIARLAFKNIGRYIAEIIKIYYGMGRDIIDNIEIRGIEHYHKAKSKNKGVIFITGHCGNWELMAIAFGLKVDNISVVVRKQNNPYLNRLIEKIRSKYGNKVIYKKGAIKRLFYELNEKRNVGILMDQAVLKEEGYIIDFLGRPSWTTKMPALLARKTGAVVMPAFINNEGKRHVINIYPEVEPSNFEDKELALIDDTKRYSVFIEDYIKSYPTEWLWIHRRWKRA